jgi:hypothetical protein
MRTSTWLQRFLVVMTLPALVSAVPLLPGLPIMFAAHRAPQGMALERVGQIGGITGAMAVSGGYAYVGAGCRVIVFDVSSPSNPIPVGQTGVLGDLVRGIDLAPGYAYVAASQAGLRIIEVTDPEHPTEVGAIEVTGGAYDVAVADAYGYVAAGGGGLRVISIADPSEPEEVNALAMPVNVHRIAVAGDYAFLAARNVLSGSVRMIDITNPLQLHEESSFSTQVSDVDVAGDYVYTVGYWGDGYLRVFLITDPSTPHEVGSLQVGAEADAVAVAGGYAYVTEWGFGHSCSRLHTISVANPTNPVEVGQVSLPGSGCVIVHDITVLGELVYLAVYDMGLQIATVHEPMAPSVIGMYVTPQSIAAAEVVGTHAYLTDSQGLWVVSVASPANPTVMGFRDIQGGGEDIAVRGQYAYVATCLDGLWILSVLDPDQPTPVGHIDFGTCITAVEVAGEYAYAVDDDGLRVISIANPAHPREISLYDAPYGISDIAAAGEHVYVISYDTLHVISVADPAHPAEIGHCETVDDGKGLAVAGHLAYVADGESGLRVISVSDPSQPVEIGLHPTLGSARSVAVADNYVFVWDTDALHVLLAADPSHPIEVGSYEAEGGGSAEVVVVGEHVYVARFSRGLTILHASYQPDGAVTLGSGVTTDVPLDDAVIITFAQPMITGTISYASIPDPGGWQETWGGSTALTLTHNTFYTATLYSFAVLDGQTSEGRSIVSFSASFMTIGAEKAYLPLACRNH